MTGARRAAEAPVADVRHTPQRGIDDSPAPLLPVSGRPPMGEYLRRLWERRHFITERAWSQAVTANRGLVLGNLWLVLNPLLDAAVYMVIFGLLFKPSIEDFSTFLVIGIFMFSVTSRDVTSASTCIRGNQGLIRAFMFPRAALPLASVVRNLIETIPIVLVMLVLVLVMVGLPGPQVLLAPMLFALHTAFNLGLAFVSARLGSAFPDAQKIIPMVFRILMYASGVMFVAERYEAVPLLAATVHHNPLFLLLDMYRDLLMRHTLPAASSWFEIAAWALGALLLGFWWFWRGEASYGRPE